MPEDKNKDKKNKDDSSGEGSEEKYLTPDQAEELVQKQLKGKATLTTDEKGALMKFVDDMGILLNVIESDDNLKNQIGQQAQKMYGGEGNNQQNQNQQGQNNQGGSQGQGQQNQGNQGGDNQQVSSQQQNQAQGQNQGSQVQQQQDQELTRKVDGVVKSRRAEIIQNFENKYGISNLPDEKKNEVRNKIGSKLLQWGHKIENVPVESLGGLMEDAYITAEPEKLKEEGRLDGILKARGGEAAAMPSMAGGSSPPAGGDEGKEFSSAAKGYMKTLGVDEDHAKEVVEKTTPA